jgi:hypothetical protein
MQPALQVAKTMQRTAAPTCLDGAPATQGSQARRRVEIHGPKARNFGNCGRVFDRLIEFLRPKKGAFRPIRPPKCTCPPPEAP